MSQAQLWIGSSLQPEAAALLEGMVDIFVSRVGEGNDWYKEASLADVIMVRGNTRVTGDVMDRLGSHLRLVARAGIGVDCVDLDAATQRGIMVVNTPDGPTESTAEHAIALMLNLCKQVMVGDRLLRSKQGFPTSNVITPGLEVAGATLGLVGLGRIGSRVATIGRALGMRVLAFDPFISQARAELLGVELVPSLEELLPQSQVVSLHCPSLPQTYHLINVTTLRLMPRGSYLINVARGALIDEAALLDAMYAGHLAGVALDVFDPEPPLTDNPLFALPNTICTPHIGSYTHAGLLRMQVMACEQIVSVLRGERPAYLVNAEVWGHQRR